MKYGDYRIVRFAGNVVGDEIFIVQKYSPAIWRLFGPSKYKWVTLSADGSAYGRKRTFESVFAAQVFLVTICGVISDDFEFKASSVWQGS